MWLLSHWQFITGVLLLSLAGLFFATLLKHIKNSAKLNESCGAPQPGAPECPATNYSLKLILKVIPKLHLALKFLHHFMPADAINELLEIHLADNCKLSVSLLIRRKEAFKN